MKVLRNSVSLLGSIFLLLLSFTNSEINTDINVTFWRLMEKHSIAGEVVQFRSDLYNDGAKYMTLLKWKTPLDLKDGRPLSDMFKVEYAPCKTFQREISQWCVIDDKAKNETLPYMGVRTKKGNPTRSSYQNLRPGSVTTKNIDLTELYDFSRFGHYTIQLDTSIIDGVRHWNTDHKIKNRVMSNYSSTLEPIQSNVLRFEIFDNKGLGRIDPTKPLEKPKEMSEYHYEIAPRIKVGSTSYPKKWSLEELHFAKTCSPEQQESISNDLKGIVHLLERISQLPRDKFDEPLKTWFDESDDETYEFAQKALKQIANFLTNKDSSNKIEWHCAEEKRDDICTVDTHSFSSARYNQITICPRHFNNVEKNEKYDTRRGVLFHEISHILFNIRDLAATDKQCKALSPERKLQNANNLQFFFEDLVHIVEKKQEPIKEEQRNEL